MAVIEDRSEKRLVRKASRTSKKGPYTTPFDESDIDVDTLTIKDSPSVASSGTLAPKKFFQEESVSGSLVPGDPFVVRARTFRGVNLTSGSNSLIHGIQKQLPAIDAPSVEVIGNSLLAKLGQGIADGDQPALLRRRPNGSFELQVFRFDRSTKRANEG
jgi:hypothetical protein